MSAVTLIDLIPLARYDGIHWAKARIQESATPSTDDADWTTLEEFTFTDPDVDPRYPKPRSFTVSGTINEGWYRAVFVDQLNQDLLPTQPIHNVPDVSLRFRPVAQDVADLLRARTKDPNGNELGSFTEATRPTLEDVEGLITQAADDVIAETDSDIPEEALPLAAAVIALGAAMRVELSFFPEQVGTPNSPYDRYKDLYDQQLARLQTAIEREALEEEEGEQAEVGGPKYFFPVGIDWDRVIW